MKEILNNKELHKEIKKVKRFYAHLIRKDDRDIQIFAIIYYDRDTKDFIEESWIISDNYRRLFYQSNTFHFNFQEWDIFRLDRKERKPYLEQAYIHRL